MAWWRRQGWSADRERPEDVPQNAETATDQTHSRTPIPAQLDRRARYAATKVTMDRVAQSLKRLGIRYLTDEDGNLLAMWERHVVLFALEGPDQEILVMRARAYHTVPEDLAQRAYAAVNEWNHTRRFMKSYVGDRTESGQFALYAEMQIPIVPGAHDALLDELIDCAAAVSGAWVDWMHDEGGIL